MEGEEQRNVLQEKFPGQYQVTLSCWRRHLALLFSDLTYTDEPHTFYEYQWEDDEDWQRLEEKSELVFYSLLPGTYKLKIRRMGEPDSMSVLMLDITMPIGYRLLFGGIVLLLLIVGVAGYYWIKTGQMKWVARVGKTLSEDGLEKEGKRNMFL